MNAFLVFLYITAFVSSVNCFPMAYRASIGISRAGNNNHASRKRRILEEKQEEQKKMKCQYLSKMFPPVIPKTCFASPPMLYSDIYTYSYKKELSDYYHNVCIPREPTFLDFICGYIIIFGVLFFLRMYLKICNHKPFGNEC